MKRCLSCEKRINAIIALEIIEEFKVWLGKTEDPDNLLGEVLDQPRACKEDETLVIAGKRYPVICETCLSQIKRDFKAHFIDFVF